MKQMLIVLLSMAFSAQLIADTVTLQNDATIYERGNRYSSVRDFGQLPRGTEIRVSDRDRIRVGRRGQAVRISRVLDPSRIRSNYSYDFAMEINRNARYYDFYVLVRDIRAPRRHRTDRVVHTGRSSLSRDREYEVCYETPRSRVVRMNEEQRSKGERNVVGGLVGAIGGQIIGGMTGNDDLGNVISAVGLGFAAVGAVQVASAKEVFYTDYDINCQTYYKPDPRRYSFRRQGQSCTTTRYYSNRWGNTTEYFQTTCSGRQFVTFERSYEIYPY